MSLVRVRIEASSKTPEGVQDDLIGAAAAIKELVPGSMWKEDEPGMDIQSTKTGYWGRLTILLIGEPG